MENIKSSWVLITGASEGLGREFAVQLASQGFNLFLVARSAAALQGFKNELQKRSRIKVETLALDLSENDSGAQVFQKASELSIDIAGLINNAAQGAWGEFTNHGVQNYHALVQLNVVTPLDLMFFFLKNCRSAKFIINVASVATWQPTPYMAVYGATKSFLNHLSLALYEECRSKNIYVQTLLPSSIDTEFDRKNGIADFKLQSVSAKEVVSASLAGLDRKKCVVVAGRGTFRQKIFALVAPKPMLLKVVGNLLRPKGFLNPPQAQDS